MNRASFVKELERAADRIAEMPRANLQVLLRRAALLIRNTGDLPHDAKIESALDSIAAERKISRSDIIMTVVRDWLKSNGYLPG
jgi:hypothetical protein